MKFVEILPLLICAICVLCSILVFVLCTKERNQLIDENKILIEIMHKIELENLSLRDEIDKQKLKEVEEDDKI